MASTTDCAITELPRPPTYFTICSRNATAPRAVTVWLISARCAASITSSAQSRSNPGIAGRDATTSDGSASM
nr:MULTISPECIES: hypothetical protein [unclassified Providencia]